MGLDYGIGLLGGLQSAVQSYSQQQAKLAELAQQEKIKNQLLQQEKIKQALEYGGYGNVGPNGEVSITEDPTAMKMLMARMRAKALSGPSAGLESADKTMGKEYVDYSAGGGAATTASNLGLLQGAVNKLKHVDVGPGGVEKPIKNDDSYSGISGYFPEFVQDFVNSRGSSVRDDIRSAIQNTLKQVLGAQYTEREGERIFARAYNPRLNDEENARRAGNVLSQLQAMASQKDAAAKHFERFHTLEGFKGATALESPIQESPGLIKKTKKIKSPEEWAANPE